MLLFSLLFAVLIVFILRSAVPPAPCKAGSPPAKAPEAFRRAVADVSPWLFSCPFVLLSPWAVSLRGYASYDWPAWCAKDEEDERNMRSKTVIYILPGAPSVLPIFFFSGLLAADHWHRAYRARGTCLSDSNRRCGIGEHSNPQVGCGRCRRSIAGRAMGIVMNRLSTARAGNVETCLPSLQACTREWL